MPSMRLSVPLTALATLSLVAACADDAPRNEQAAGQQSTKWGYEGAGAPENWGKLNAKFVACESGSAQSPINLAGARTSDLPNPQFDYGRPPAAVQNLGHTVQVNYEPGNRMTVGDTSYELAQFHFHTPSEHQLEGREFPAEIHFVHLGPDDQLAVVGVLVKEGQENAALSGIWSQLPQEKGEPRQLASAKLNTRALLPAGSRHYLYSGSLTTPPCSETVTWMVLDKPIEMSARQIAALRSIIGTSNRPVQPLGERELRLDT